MSSQTRQPLEGKSLVTGSSRGVGRAIAERLAADGAALVINYTRNPQHAQEAVNDIIVAGGKAGAIQADISKPAEVRRLFDEVEKAVGIWRHSRMARNLKLTYHNSPRSIT